METGGHIQRDLAGSQLRSMLVFPKALGRNMAFSKSGRSAFDLVINWRDFLK